MIAQRMTPETTRLFLIQIFAERFPSSPLERFVQDAFAPLCRLVRAAVVKTVP